MKKKKRVRSRERHLGQVLIESLRQFGSIDDVSDLVKRGAMVNVKDHGETALHVAARRSTFKVCEKLLMEKADVNSRDSKGLTPLHMASMRGSGVLVRLFLKHGANSEARDMENRTPADVVKSESDAANVLGRRYRGSLYGPPTTSTKNNAWVHQIKELAVDDDDDDGDDVTSTPPPPPQSPQSPQNTSSSRIQEQQQEQQQKEEPPTPPPITPYHHPVKPRRHELSRIEMRRKAQKLRDQNNRLVTAFTNLITTQPSYSPSSSSPKRIMTSELISQSSLESKRSEVALWLKRLRMDRYINTFLLSGFVSLPLVATITNSNLKDMGIAKAHIEKVLVPAIRDLSSSQAIMHERARNACDMEYTTARATNLIVKESKTSMSSSTKYIYVRENERYSPETHDWGRAYPKHTNLNSTDPPRWCDETGTRAATTTPANLFAHAPQGFVWIGSWEIVQPVHPSTGRPSGDRSGWRYSTSFSSMLLVGGVWLSPTPFTVVRQRMWRRRIRKVADEDAQHTSENLTRTTTSSSSTTKTVTTQSPQELMMILNQISNSQDTIQNNILKKITNKEEVQQAQEQFLHREKELEQQYKDMMKEAKTEFEQTKSILETKIQIIQKSLDRARENHKKRLLEEQQRHENIKREFLEREIVLNNQTKQLQESVASQKAEAHRSIEQSKEEIAKLRMEMEHELAKSHEELIEAVKRRENAVRSDCRENEIEIEKRHNETIAMLNLRASKAVENAVKEGSEEIARANRRTAKEVANSRQELILEIDRIRKDAHDMISRSIQNSLKECLRERALRTQAENALEVATRRSNDSLLQAERAESELRVAREELSVLRKELESLDTRFKECLKQREDTERERARVVHEMEIQRNSCDMEIMKIEQKCRDTILDVEKDTARVRAECSVRVLKAERQGENREMKLKSKIESEIDLRQDAQRKEMIALKESAEVRERLRVTRIELLARDDKIEKLLVKLRDSKDMIEKLNVNVRRLEVEVSVRDERASVRDKIIEKLRKDVAERDQIIEKLKKDINERDKMIKNVNENVEKLKTDLDKDEGKIEKMNLDAGELDKVLRSQKEKEKMLGVEVSKLQKDLQERDVKIQTLSDEIQKLQETKSSMVTDLKEKLSQSEQDIEKMTQSKENALKKVKLMIDPIVSECLKDAYKREKHAYYEDGSKDRSIYNKALELKRRWKVASGDVSTGDVDAAISSISSMSPKQRDRNQKSFSSNKNPSDDDDDDDDDAVVVPP